MLKDMINKIESLKQALYDKIKSLPQNEKITIVNEQPRCFTIMFSEVIDNPLAPYYFDFQSQYKMIVENLENTRIENFDKTLQTIIESGKLIYQKHTYQLNPKVIEYLKEILTDKSPKQ